MLWHYIDSYSWMGTWVPIQGGKRFEMMSPSQAAGTFDSISFGLPSPGIARWYAYDKGKWVKVDEERKGF